MNFLKKVGKSFLGLFLFSAIVHIIILIASVAKNGDIKHLNYFRIIGLEEFWPKITDGRISDLISALIMLAVVTIFLLIYFKKIKD